MALPPALEIVNRVECNPFCEYVYRFKDGTAEYALHEVPWYFTVSVSHCAYSVAIFACTETGKCVAIDGLYDNLRKQFKHIIQMKDGRIMIDCYEGTVDETACLWRFSGYSQYVRLIENGVLTEERLTKIQTALDDVDVTKDQVKTLFESVFGKRLKLYQEYLKLIEGQQPEQVSPVERLDELAAMLKCL